MIECLTTHVLSRVSFDNGEVANSWPVWIIKTFSALNVLEVYVVNEWKLRVTESKKAKANVNDM